ncbi:MAG: PTS sugar transporter subunit IIA [Clostridia bacterium]
MTGLIVATHGDLALAALNVVEMFTGSQKQVQTIGFRSGDSLEDLLDRFQAALEALSDCEDILAVTDLKGGSPCNAATVMKMKNNSVRVIAGFSIPVLIQFFEDRENGMTLAESMETLLDVGKLSLSEISL